MAHRRLETAFVVVALLLYSNALIGPLFAPDETASDDLAWLRYLWLPAYAGTAAFCLLRAKAMVRAWPALLLLGVLTAWAIVSTLWSLDPETTGRRGVALAATTLFGVYLAASYPRGGFVPVLGGCFIALALGSVAMALGYPRLGVHSDVNAGDWRGLWYQKNALGGMMAYGVATCMAAAALTRRRGWWAGAALCFGLVLMSRSKTALLCTLAPAAVQVLVRGMRRSAVAAVTGVFLAGTAAEALGALAWLAPDALLKALGKDPTLTGRTDIWAAIFRQLAHQPWRGYGYGAFWLKTSAPAQFVRAETRWLVPSAHNGWIDVLVQVGWIGAALSALVVLAALLAAAVSGWRLADGGWALGVLTAFLIRSLSESVLIAQNSLDWAMFAAVLTSLLLHGAGRAPRQIGPDASAAPAPPARGALAPA